MVSKTREKLVDVARQLFARKGIDNTTMNDIANASDKGRRTIYTYFKNKREISAAVVERESELRVAELRQVADRTDLTLVEKLQAFLHSRFHYGEDNPGVYSSIKSFLSRDFRRLERIRRLAYEKELGLLQTVLDRGVADGVFRPEQAARLKECMPRLMQSIDMAAIHDQGTNLEEVSAARESLIRFIVDGIIYCPADLTLSAE